MSVLRSEEILALSLSSGDRLSSESELADCSRENLAWTGGLRRSKSSDRGGGEPCNVVTVWRSRTSLPYKAAIHRNKQHRNDVTGWMDGILSTQVAAISCL